MSETEIKKLAAATGWANLPSELLVLVAQWLNLADVIRLRAVCFCWEWTFGKTFNCSLHRTPQPNAPIFRSTPWLLLSYPPKKYMNFCSFYSLSEDRSYQLSPLLKTNRQSFVGSSSDGWLVTIDSLFTPLLINPLTHQELSLPSLFTLHDNSGPLYLQADESLFEDFDDKFKKNLPAENFLAVSCGYEIRKIILTSSMLQGGIAVGFFSVSFLPNSLAFATIRDEAWSPFLKVELGSDFFEDVICNEEDGKLYALTNQGAVYILECANDRSWYVAFMVSGCLNDKINLSQRRYLIFSCGELLQVTKENKGQLHDIKVFRFDPNCHNHHEKWNHKKSKIEIDPRHCPFDSCWVPLNDLGNRSLFVGSNTSFSLNCIDELRIMRNSVYFTTDLINPSEHDSHVFDLKTGKSYWIPIPNGPPLWAMWFVPTLKCDEVVL